MRRAVLSTRPEGEADPLAALLRAAGLRVHAVPTIATEPVEFEPPPLARYDWVVVTSAVGVRALLDRTPAPAGPRWAAVGPRTAAELRLRGITAGAVPAESRGVRVAEAIAEHEPLADLRVLLARADAAAADLPLALRAAGATVEEVAAYRTVVGPESSRAGVEAALADPDLGVLVFASGSAVAGLLALAAADPRGFPAVTIGPATSEAARRAGFRVAAEAERAASDALGAAVLAVTGESFW